MQKIQIYVGGKCKGKDRADNIGFYGIIVKYDDKEAKYKGIYRCGTPNELHLFAVTKILKSLARKDIPIELYLDSVYVETGINKWLQGWKSNDWCALGCYKIKVQNLKAWQELSELLDSFDNIKVLKNTDKNTKEFVKMIIQNYIKVNNKVE